MRSTSMYLFYLLISQTPCVLGNVMKISSHRSGADVYQDERRNATISLSISNEPHNYHGHPSCPCVDRNQLASHHFDPRSAKDVLGAAATDTYGLSCAPHDLNSPICQDVDMCTTRIPLPPDCDKSFCQRSFCFVDPKNCSLYHKPSSVYPELHYSYATCGHMDSFTYMERRKSLQGRTLKVALNSNTGGWMGAYNPEGSFAMNQLWSGPMVEFIKDAARRGGFDLDITAPPEWLRAESQKFFGDSSFDFCVYATSLGYLDLCISAYTITDKRASVTPFFELGSDPVYLVTFTDDETGTEYAHTFVKSLLTIFQPFTFGSWIMIVVICLPVLGLLMLFHEYGTHGSAFPSEEEMMVTDVHTGEQKVETREIAARKHIPKAFYMSFLSFFNGSYDPVVVTTGGKIHLLAILSFVLLVLAVYTANLAAILTQDASKSPIDSLEEAIKANYNFCASRKVANRIIDLFGVEPERIVSDPVHLGGDGMAGFNCPTCGARERIFDFMNNDFKRDRSIYCNAALASYEDLQVLHQYGLHCNKSAVGDILAFRDFGVPITTSFSAELMSWFYEMKYEGVLDRHIREATPQSQCLDNEGEEGIALNVEQLTGIWTVVFGFALVGLMATLLGPIFDTRKFQWAERRLARYDQWSNIVDDPLTEDEINDISANADKTRDTTTVMNDLSNFSSDRGTHFPMVTKFPTKGMAIKRANSKGENDKYLSCRSISAGSHSTHDTNDLEMEIQINS